MSDHLFLFGEIEILFFCLQAVAAIHKHKEGFYNWLIPFYFILKTALRARDYISDNVREKIEVKMWKIAISILLDGISGQEIPQMGKV